MTNPNNPDPENQPQVPPPPASPPRRTVITPDPVAPPPPQAPPGQMPPPPTMPPLATTAHPTYANAPVGTNGKATASLVLGICGLVVCPILVSVPAVILGLIAQREIRENPGQGGEGQAKAGWILGVIGLAIWLIILVLYLALVVWAVSETNDYSYGYYD